MPLHGPPTIWFQGTSRISADFVTAGNTRAMSLLPSPLAIDFSPTTSMRPALVCTTFTVLLVCHCAALLQSPAAVDAARWNDLIAVAKAWLVSSIPRRAAPAPAKASSTPRAAAKHRAAAAPAKPRPKKRSFRAPIRASKRSTPPLDPDEICAALPLADNKARRRMEAEYVDNAKRKCFARTPRHVQSPQSPQTLATGIELYIPNIDHRRFAANWSSPSIGVATISNVFLSPLSRKAIRLHYRDEAKQRLYMGYAHRLVNEARPIRVAQFCLKLPPRLLNHVFATAAIHAQITGYSTRLYGNAQYPNAVHWWINKAAGRAVFDRYDAPQYGTGMDQDENVEVPAEAALAEWFRRDETLQSNINRMLAQDGDSPSPITVSNMIAYLRPDWRNHLGDETLVSPVRNINILSMIPLRPNRPIRGQLYHYKDIRRMLHMALTGFIQARVESRMATGVLNTSAFAVVHTGTWGVEFNNNVVLLAIVQRVAALAAGVHLLVHAQTRLIAMQWKVAFKAVKEHIWPPTEQFVNSHEIIQRIEAMKLKWM